MTLEDEFAALFEDCGDSKSFNYDYESEIIQYIKDINTNNIEIIFNTKIDNIEVLCYIPSKNLAVKYYESDKYDEAIVGKKYFYNISALLGSKNIQLFNIYDYEWFNEHKRLIIKSMLQYMMNPSHIIYARQTKVCEMGTYESKPFINSNHLQGDTSSKVKIGLYYESKPVAVMSFGESRFNNDYAYEIIRSCYKQGYSIVGGVSKILKYFIKNYQPYKIISYSDIGKFSSRSYVKAGMQLVGITDPGYVWTKDGEELQRYQCMKHKLIAKGWGIKQQTENEIMRSHGYKKVYNAGNRKFQWVSDKYQV